MLKTLIPQNRTKIIATIGPASGEKKVLTKIVESGMDIARFNFSHGDYGTFEKWLDNIRQINCEKDTQIEVLQDLQGPRIRVGGDIPKKGIRLKDGQIINVGFGKFKKGFLPIDYKNIIKDVKAGTKILLVDGLIELEVLKKEKKFLKTKIIRGGLVLPHKGVNIPGEKLSIGSLTQKDLADLAWGVKNKVDYVGLSFVRSAEDIKKLRRLILKKDKKSKIKIIPKIEKPQAVKNIKSIIKASDGIMIARGDLGIEVGVEKVPEIQKDIILKCKAAKKFVIVATQMMESMITNPSPTRAEVSDVANAVFDGTDAVMLSGETTVGKYPVEVVKMIEKILRESEKEKFAKRFSLKNIFIRKKQ